ncbi:CBO0543 family protein [Alkalihalobacillus sp. MEB130]|uniref:CBO0543 family protein n=1 Tax=Alkalihalobacillus sp. MEB130 TaxID=2976704 RepID=UPI0037BF307D
MHLALSSILFFMNLRRKHYRNLNKFLPSILYVMFFNSLYYYFFKHFLLWEVRSTFVKVKFLRALYIFFVLPNIILLYLSEFPSRFLQQIIYLVKWITLSSAIEYFLFKKTKALSFHHKWSMGWSICIYVKMYLFSYLLLKKPGMIMSLSITSTLCFLYLFKPPMSKGFLEGPLLKAIKRAFPRKERKKCFLLRIGE